MKSVIKIIFPVFILAGCISAQVSPIVVDRHTVMEQEAAGEWPEFDREFRKQEVKPETTFLPKEPASKKKDRVFSILRGEYQSEASN